MIWLNQGSKRDISIKAYCIATPTWGIWIIVTLILYRKTSFPKRVKGHSRKWDCNAKFKGYVLVKIFWHMCICTYFIKSSFPKHDRRTWHWHRNIDSFLLALNTLWKRALHVLKSYGAVWEMWIGYWPFNTHMCFIEVRTVSVEACLHFWWNSTLSYVSSRHNAVQPFIPPMLTWSGYDAV